MWGTIRTNISDTCYPVVNPTDRLCPGVKSCCKRSCREDQEGQTDANQDVGKGESVSR